MNEYSIVKFRALLLSYRQYQGSKSELKSRQQQQVSLLKLGTVSIHIELVNYHSPFIFSVK